MGMLDAYDSALGALEIFATQGHRIGRGRRLAHCHSELVRPAASASLLNENASAESLGRILTKNALSGSFSF